MRRERADRGTSSGPFGVVAVRGRTPVVRVVAAMTDPHPKVAGQGFAELRNSGVHVDILELPQARGLNPGYLSRMTTGRPWIRLKVAVSADGRTAMANGESQWITGPEARADVQRWRARSCAVLTGSGTVLADDPQLNVRMAYTPYGRYVHVPPRLPTTGAFCVVFFLCLLLLFLL